MPKPDHTPSPRGALAALSLATLLASLGISSANIALPVLAQAFGASFQSVQWVVVAYLLGSTTLIVSVGRLGDLAGRRRLLLAGIALYAGASLLCGLAPALWVLIAARAVQGLGAAVMTALAMALAGQVTATARAGSAMGLLGTMSAIGTALGPSLGGLLIVGSGWRAIFLVNVPAAVMALALARRCLPEDRQEAERPGLDRLGTLLLALTLGAYALAMTSARGSIGPASAALLLAAGIGAVLFLRVEARAASPLLRPAMLREAGLAAGLATNVLVATVMMATLVVGPFYLSRGLGLGTAIVGLVMSVGPVTSALSGVPAGRIVDRLGPPLVTIAGLAGVGAGCSLLAILPATLGVAGYLGPLLIATAGYQLFQAANNTAVMADVAAARRGVVSGLLGLSRNLGLITGASAMGAVFALAAGSPDIGSAAPAAVAAGMRATFGVAAALIALALAIALGSRLGVPRRIAGGLKPKSPAAAAD